MSNKYSAERAVGLFFIRVLLGIIFFMQGFGKVFTWGIEGVYASAFKSYEATFLPKWLIYSTAYYTSFVELIGGALLLLGLFRKWAYFALGSVLLIVSFGHGLASPIWSLDDVFPRAILLAALLLLPTAWDSWSLDHRLTNAKYQ
ncbi:MAG: DoxX family membrane protein [Bacteroidota bacterium]